MSEEKVGVNEILMFSIGMGNIFPGQVLKIAKLGTFKTRLDNDLSILKSVSQLGRETESKTSYLTSVPASPFQ